MLATDSLIVCWHTHSVAENWIWLEMDMWSVLCHLRAFFQNEPVRNKCWLLIFCVKLYCNPWSHLVYSHFLLYSWTKCLRIFFCVTGVCIISVSMAVGVPRRGLLSLVIALVQDTVELRAITVGLRNGFLHFKHTYCVFIMSDVLYCTCY